MNFKDIFGKQTSSEVESPIVALSDDDLATVTGGNRGTSDTITIPHESHNQTHL